VIGSINSRPLFFAEFTRVLTRYPTIIPAGYFFNSSKGFNVRRRKPGIPIFAMKNRGHPFFDVVNFGQKFASIVFCEPFSEATSRNLQS
jgi:hypothetical protein